MHYELPVFGICGYSGSGKTTVIEKIIPHLTAKNLKVAIIKHNAHTIDIDPEGVDSDRLFRAGADVLLQGGGEEHFRVHKADELNLLHVITSLLQKHDIVLVEGGKNLPVNKVWLQSEERKDVPPEVGETAAVLPWESERVETVVRILDKWLAKQWLKTPVYGCVLIGGKSTRMAASKHLIVENGTTWLEKEVELLDGFVQTVVIAGEGDVPEGLSGCVLLPDVPGIQGPMAGVLSAMRWAPSVSWLIAACDMPYLSGEALKWLLSLRRPGVWASIPQLNSKGVEPLLAHYDFRALTILENLASGGDFSLAKAAEHPKVKITQPPDRLAGSWTNINTETELFKILNSPPRSPSLENRK